jgi:hypothetical protein
MENTIKTQQERLRLSFSGCKNDKEDKADKPGGGVRGGGYGRKMADRDNNKNCREVSYKF